MIVAIMPCHNRAACASAAAKALWENTAEDTHLVIVDDCSTDNTGEAVREAWPGTLTCIRNDKELFWAQSLAIGEAHAKSLLPEHILWLNEDTYLTQPIAPMLFPASIGVATVTTPAGRRIKGALKRTGPLSFRLASVGETADTFNGHCVAIPRNVFLAMHIAPYSHAFADIHYGLTARRRAIPLVATSVVATTSPQQRVNWRDLPMSTERARACFRQTGLPPRDWLFFCFSFGGPLAPLRFLAAYRYLFRKRDSP